MSNKNKKIAYHACGSGVTTVTLKLYPSVEVYEICVTGADDVTAEVKPATGVDHFDQTTDIDLGFLPIANGTIAVSGGVAIPVKFSGFHQELKLTSASAFSYIVNGGNV